MGLRYEKPSTMKTVFAAVIGSVALSGCMSFDVFDAEFPKYYGRHIDTLVAKLGYPNAEQTVMNRKFYIWTTSEQFLMTTPTISSSSGYVGTTPISVTGTSFQTNVLGLSCTIRARVDDAEIIQGINYGGANGTCFRYSNLLEK